MAVSQHTCARCGVQFFGRATKYCSAACRIKAKNVAKAERQASAAGRVYAPRVFAGPGGAPVTHTPHECKACGKIFYPKGPDRTQFCGRACGLAFTGLQATLRRNSGRVWVQVKRKKCVRCGKCHARPAPTCSKECNAPATAYVKVDRGSCRNCGGTFSRASEGASRFICSAACRAQIRAKANKVARKSPSRRADKAARKAMQRGATGADRIDPIKVCERDGWKCRLCGRKTPKRLRGTHDDRAPEVDHILPVSLGGKHVWANVQCACRACNIAKGARPMGQLMLFPVAA